MLQDMLPRHLVTLFLIILLSILLRSQKSFRDSELRYFWLTVLSCLLLMFEDALEIIASEDPSLRFWRILLSVLGYTFRSTAALGLLLVVVPREKRTFRLWVPALITLAVSATAFFSDIAFSFDEDYDFCRGPLGYVAFVVPALYLLMIMWITYRHFSEHKSIQAYIIPGCAVFCMAAAITDALHGGIRLHEAVLISSIFFYILLRAHDHRRDPLTGLLNRQAFYDDCTSFNDSISAVASLDMNGLKRMNDTLGHYAGDKALVSIAGCMKEIVNRNTQAYRIGGDEFVILFLSTKEDDVAAAISRVRESISKAGCSVSTGCVMREKGSDLEETIRESDSKMYADKAEYYRSSGHDRRRRRDDRERPAGETAVSPPQQ